MTVITGHAVGSSLTKIVMEPGGAPKGHLEEGGELGGGLKCSNQGSRMDRGDTL